MEGLASYRVMGGSPVGRGGYIHTPRTRAGKRYHPLVTPPTAAQMLRRLQQMLRQLLHEKRLP